MARGRAADERHILRGIRTSTANNAPAYGFSLATTASFGAAFKVHGEPSWGELFLFLIAASVGFAVVNAFSTWFYRRASPDEPELVISLATSFSLISVCATVGTSIGLAYALPAWLAWPATGLALALVYIAGVGLEIGFAAYRHPQGGVAGERARSR